MMEKTPCFATLWVRETFRQGTLRSTATAMGRTAPLFAMFGFQDAISIKHLSINRLDLVGL